MDANSQGHESDSTKLEEYKEDLYQQIENFMSGKIVRIFQLGTSLFIAVIVPLVVAFSRNENDFQAVADVLVIFVILGGAINIFQVYDASMNVRKIRQINERLKRDKHYTDKELHTRNPLKSVQKTIDIMQVTYISGVVLSGAFWFVRAEENPRLEPLTLLLGFGASLFAYFRAQLPERPLVDLEIKVKQRFFKRRT